MAVAWYCTRDEVKKRLGGYRTGDTADDVDIDRAIESACSAIDEHCGPGRHFGQLTIARTFEPKSLYCLRVDDLVSITSLRTDASGDGVFETTWNASDYYLGPVNALTLPVPRPFTEIHAVGGRTFPAWSYAPMMRRNRIEITGVFGWPALPATIKEAALALIADHVKAKDAAFGVQAYGDFHLRVRDNPRVAAMLRPYERYPIKSSGLMVA